MIIFFYKISCYLLCYLTNCCFSSWWFVAVVEVRRVLDVCNSKHLQWSRYLESTLTDAGIGVECIGRSFRDHHHFWHDQVQLVQQPHRLLPQHSSGLGGSDLGSNCCSHWLAWKFIPIICPVLIALAVASSYQKAVPQNLIDQEWLKQSKLKLSSLLYSQS